jgi:hypothetical protein
MPLPDQLVTINIAGLSQKIDPKARQHGTLERADNVEFEKAGTINKRRGYRYVSTFGGDVNNNPAPQLFCAVAQHRDELLMVSDDLWSVLSPIRDVDGTGVILRGPMPRGGYRIRAIVGTGVSEEDLAP